MRPVLFDIQHGRCFYCKYKKRARLPACEHLGAWSERNAKYGSQIAAELEQRGMVAETGCIEPGGGMGLRADRGRARAHLGLGG